MNCKKCDAENLDSAKFCKICGHKLEPGRIEPTKKKQSGKSAVRKNKGAAAAIIVIGLLSIGAGIIHLKERRIVHVHGG